MTNLITHHDVWSASVTKTAVFEKYLKMLLFTLIATLPTWIYSVILLLLITCDNMYSLDLRKKVKYLPAIHEKCRKIFFSCNKWHLELIETLCDHINYLSWCVECFCCTKLNISVITSEKYLKMWLFIQYSSFHMSHFHTSQPTTAFYPKLGCIQSSLQKLQMLTPVHKDAKD